MLEAVCRLLSMYPTMEQAMDQAPRLAHKLAALRPWIQEAERLYQCLEGEVYSDENEVFWDLTLDGYTFDGGPDFLERLKEFIECARRAQETFQSQESRRGPTRRAASYLIFKLSHLFDYYYRRKTFSKLDRDRWKAKGEEWTGEHESWKADFIATALDGAKIPRPGWDVDLGRRTGPGRNTRARSRLLQNLPEICKGCRQRKPCQAISVLIYRVHGNMRKSWMQPS